MKTWTLKKVEKETEPNCWYCGTAIKWVCWVESNDNDIKAVGVHCCENFLSVSNIKKTKGEINELKKGEKLHQVIDTGIARAIELHGPEAETKQAKSDIANWMNCKGATWQWIKENYRCYFYARYPNG